MSAEGGEKRGEERNFFLLFLNQGARMGIRRKRRGRALTLKKSFTPHSAVHYSSAGFNNSFFRTKKGKTESVLASNDITKANTLFNIENSRSQKAKF